MFQGQCIRCTALGDGVVEMCFDRQNGPVNLFDRATLDEFRAAVESIAGTPDLSGVLLTSGKDVFIVGADITEFGEAFEQSEADIAAWAARSNEIFNAFEDLPVPSVAAINGFALGGGLEMALSADYRVMSTAARVGLPETKLGIIPGFGGTVRLPRLIGADNAIEWIAAGGQHKPEAALKVHAVDAVVAPDKLRGAALQLLKLAQGGKYDWRARREQKNGPLKLSPVEAMLAFESARGLVAQQAGRHYPAPLAVVDSIQKAAAKGRDEALKIEGAAFARLARTKVAKALIGIFLNDQMLKRKAKSAGKQAHKIERAAVLGAGIMGGGIAYQSASTGTPIVMKDIADKALDLGMSEANKLLARQVERGKFKPEKAGAILSSIRPTLSYDSLRDVDIVVEAVVENPKIKKSVLAEVESVVGERTIIATNTSSISIDELAGALARPENFLGMHFFNPVHRMPLVEVIYGEKTGKEAIATVTAYAAAMGKTPITVRNCPGFLVNRVLFPYFFGFFGALRAGGDFVKIDKVMEGFGWPMGPAYLNDVVGLDTAHHVGEVLAAGYPDRMAMTDRSALDVLYEGQRFGQKNGIGFYRYETDPKGKPKKIADESSYALIAEIQPEGQKDLSEEDIVDRMMLPMIIETARCLEEGIVETPNEADMGLILGVGFPPHIGGTLRYADTLGLATVVEKCGRYAALGKLYEPTEAMKQMAAEGKTYY